MDLRQSIQNYFDKTKFHLEKQGLVLKEAQCKVVLAQKDLDELKARKREYRTQREVELFSRFDSDGDGEITWTEFTTAFKAMRPDCSDERVTAQFALLDTDGDGFVSSEEFKNGLTIREWSGACLNKRFSEWFMDTEQFHYLR